MLVRSIDLTIPITSLKMDWSEAMEAAAATRSGSEDKTTLLEVSLNREASRTF